MDKRFFDFFPKRNSLFNFNLHQIRSRIVFLFSFLILNSFLFPQYGISAEKISPENNESDLRAAARLKKAIDSINKTSSVENVSISLVPKKIERIEVPSARTIQDFWGVCETENIVLIKRLIGAISDAHFKSTRLEIRRPEFEQIIRFETKENHVYEFRITKALTTDGVDGLLRIDGVSSVFLSGRSIVQVIYEVAGSAADNLECKAFSDVEKFR